MQGFSSSTNFYGRPRKAKAWLKIHAIVLCVSMYFKLTKGQPRIRGISWAGSLKGPPQKKKRKERKERKGREGKEKERKKERKKVKKIEKINQHGE